MNNEHLETLAAFFDNSELLERYFRAQFNKSSPQRTSIFDTGGQWQSGNLGDVHTYRVPETLTVTNIICVSQGLLILCTFRRL